MKRWVWILLIFLVAGSVGGYSLSHYREVNRQYTEYMDSGTIALKQGNYDAAKNYYTNANKLKNKDTKATAILNQIKTYKEAQSKFKNHQFSDAKAQFNNVTKQTEGSKVLADRASTKITLIQKIQKNFKEFSKILKTAKEQNNAWMFGDSNITLDSLFNNADFSDGYYQTLYEQATKLQADNNSGVTQNSVNATNGVIPSYNYQQPTTPPSQAPSTTAPSDSSQPEHSSEAKSEQSNSSATAEESKSQASSASGHTSDSEQDHQSSNKPSQSSATADSSSNKQSKN